LQRNDLEYRKPKLVPGKLNPAKQQAFIDGYENFLNNLDVDKAVVFADAAHPTHEVRPACCWAPKDTRIAFEGTSGRQRLNIHGAVDLETGSTRMIETITINATSTIALLMAIVSMYPTKDLFTSSSITPGMLSWFRNGWQDQDAGSSSTSFRATVHTSIRSSAYGD
jgi:hypothetical protein